MDEISLDEIRAVLGEDEGGSAVTYPDTPIGLDEIQRVLSEQGPAESVSLDELGPLPGDRPGGYRGVGNTLKNLAQGLTFDLAASAVAGGGLALEQLQNEAALFGVESLADLLPKRSNAQAGPADRAEPAYNVAPGSSGVLGSPGVTPTKLWEDAKAVPGVAERAQGLAQRIREEGDEAIGAEISESGLGRLVDTAARSGGTTLLGAGVGLATGAATRNPGAGLAAGSAVMALADASGTMEETYKRAIEQGYR